MASHNRTPRSVLEAPKRTVIAIWEHRGENRAERRRPRKHGGTRQGFNQPYMKPRGK
jgi:hypothetical protein